MFNFLYLSMFSHRSLHSSETSAWKREDNFFVFNSNVHGITFSPEVSVTETSFR